MQVRLINNQSSVLGMCLLRESIPRKLASAGVSKRVYAVTFFRLLCVWFGTAKGFVNIRVLVAIVQLQTACQPFIVAWHLIHTISSSLQRIQLLCQPRPLRFSSKGVLFVISALAERLEYAAHSSAKLTHIMAM